MLPQNKQPPAPPAPKALHGFRSDAAEVEHRPVPVRARWVLYLMALFLALAFGWSCLAQVDKIVTAPGKIVSPQENLMLSALETSVIRQIHVAVGQQVEQGQTLITLDPTFAEAGLEEQTKKLESLKAQLWRLECETGSACPAPTGIDPGELAAQQSFMHKRRQEFEAKMSALVKAERELAAKLATNAAAAEQSRKQIKIAQDLEAMYRDVFEKGASSRLEYMKAQSARIDAESLLLKLGNESKELDQALGKARSERESFVSGWHAAAMKELVDARREHDQTQERARKAWRVRELITLTAPKAGVVLELARRSVGSVAEPGAALVTLVPQESALEAEVEVKPSDIGFIREGDPARVKLDPFPFQRHGVLEGAVRTISPDAFEKKTAEGQAFLYRARVAVTPGGLREAPRDFRLIPGMTLTAEIKVGTRRVITYLIYPLIRSLDETMREP